MRFEELSESAKKVVRDRERDWLDYEWWDAVYEDFLIILKIMGVEAEAKHIWFSGFWSQGDGASFTGYYRCAPDACQKIAEHAPQDEELHRIAAELTAIQVAAQMELGATWWCNIQRCGRYDHSHTMSIESLDLSARDARDHLPDEPDEDKVISALTQLFRDLADWLYEALEAEYEYLTSDECIAEQGLDYDEDGAIIEVRSTLEPS